MAKIFKVNQASGLNGKQSQSHSALTKPEQFVRDFCKERFDNPKSYTNRTTGVTRTTQLVLCQDIGQLLQAGWPEQFSDQQARIDFYQSLQTRGIVKKAWAGRMPALADNRYTVERSISIDSGEAEFLQRYLAK